MSARPSPDDDRYWASWADWLDVPRHTCVSTRRRRRRDGRDNARGPPALQARLRPRPPSTVKPARLPAAASSSTRATSTTTSGPHCPHSEPPGSASSSPGTRAPRPLTCCAPSTWAPTWSSPPANGESPSRRPTSSTRSSASPRGPPQKRCTSATTRRTTSSPPTPPASSPRTFDADPGATGGPTTRSCAGPPTTPSTPSRTSSASSSSLDEAGVQAGQRR
jgi:hypothetical protein